MQDLEEEIANLEQLTEENLIDTEPNKDILDTEGLQQEYDGDFIGRNISIDPLSPGLNPS